MNKFFITLIGCTALLGAAAHAEIVQSGSKYPIVVSVFKGNSQCNPNVNELTAIGKNASQTYKGTKGNVLSKGIESLKQMYNGAMQGSGCEKIGNDYVLPSNATMNLPVGAVVLAFKNPLAALEESNKIVNPLPALCKVVPGKKILLETRKSEGLRNIIGLAGDGGLKCTFK